METLAIGQDLGPYRIEALLGKGGMGVVYLARDRDLRRSVAIKIADQTRAPFASPRSLVREARAAAALNHPAICGIHEIGHIGSDPFIVMEHVDGEPLSVLVPPTGLPVDRTLHYAIQIVDALAHAHRFGIAHGDLKAANVMVMPDGRIKLLDFGLAVQWTAEAETTGACDLASCAGTVPYMAPERLRGERPDAQSDVWSIGVLLYELLTGTRPFGGATVYAVAAAVLGSEPSALPHRVPRPLARCRRTE